MRFTSSCLCGLFILFFIPVGVFAQVNEYPGIYSYEKDGNFVVTMRIQDGYNSHYECKLIDGNGKDILATFRFISLYDTINHCRWVYNIDRAISGPNGYKEIWGLINNRGKLLLPTIYDYYACFNKGVGSICTNGKCGLIDNKGHLITLQEYDAISMLPANENYVFAKNHKYGLVRSNGNILTPPTYDTLTTFINGYAKFRMNGKWGLINSTGRIVIEPQYTSLSHYEKPLNLYYQFANNGIISCPYAVTYFSLFNKQEDKDISVDNAIIDFITTLESIICECDFKKYRDPEKSGPQKIFSVYYHDNDLLVLMEEYSNYEQQNIFYHNLRLNDGKKLNLNDLFFEISVLDSLFQNKFMIDNTNMDEEELRHSLALYDQRKYDWSFILSPEGFIFCNSEFEAEVSYGNEELGDIKPFSRVTFPWWELKPYIKMDGPWVKWIK